MCGLQSSPEEHSGEGKNGVFKEILPFVLTELAGPWGGAFGPLMGLIPGPLFSVTLLHPLQCPQSRVPLNKQDISPTYYPQEQVLVLRGWKY